MSSKKAKSIFDIDHSLLLLCTLRQQKRVTIPSSIPQIVIIHFVNVLIVRIFILVFIILVSSSLSFFVFQTFVRYYLRRSFYDHSLVCILFKLGDGHKSSTESSPLLNFFTHASTPVIPISWTELHILTYFCTIKLINEASSTDNVRFVSCDDSRSIIFLRSAYRITEKWKEELYYNFHEIYKNSNTTPRFIFSFRSESSSFNTTSCSTV